MDLKRLWEEGTPVENNQPQDLARLWEEGTPVQQDTPVAMPQVQAQDSGFDDWYAGWSQKTGIDPNPDHPDHHYDYRAAYEAGAEPTMADDGFYHWPSEFKADDHPNRYVDGRDTKNMTELPPAWPEAIAPKYSEDKFVQEGQPQVGDREQVLSKLAGMGLWNDKSFDPENGLDIEEGRAVQEDLSATETWQRSLQKGYAQEQLGRLQFEKIVGNTDPEINARIEELRSFSDQEIPASALHINMINAAGEMLPIMLEASKEGAKKGGLSAGVFAAITAAANIGPQAVSAPITIPAAAGMGFAAGSAYGSAEYIYRVEAGLAYDEFMKFSDESGRGLDPKIARNAALLVGGVNSLIEVSQIGTILKTIPGAKNLTRKITGGLAKKAAQSKTLAEAVMRIAGRYGKFLGVETGQEVLQESANIVGGEIAKLADEALHGSDFDHISYQEVIDRLDETASQSILAFIPMGGVTHGAQVATVAGQKVKQDAKFNKLKKEVAQTILADLEQSYKDGYISKQDIEEIRAQTAGPEDGMYQNLTKIMEGEQIDVSMFESEEGAADTTEQLNNLKAIIINDTGLSDVVVETPEKTTRAMSLAGKVGKALGINDVVFFRGEGVADALNGMYDRESGTIYINQNAESPYLTILGHETWHRLEDKHPDLAEKFIEATKGMDIGFDEYVETRNLEREAQGIGRIDPENLDDWRSEFIGDFARQQFSNKDFWKKINEKDPDLGQRLAQVVIEIVDRVRGLLRDEDVNSQYFAELNAVQDALASVYTEMARRETEVKDATATPVSETKKAAEQTPQQQFDALWEGLSDSEKTRLSDLKTDEEMTSEERLGLLQAEVASTGGKFSVKSVEKKFRDQGVEISTFDTNKGDVKLNTIIVPKDQRKEGLGSKIMEELVAEADRAGKRIILTPAQRDDFHGTTSRSRLVKFYKRFGFVENKGRNKDFTISESMYRDPSGKPAPHAKEPDRPYANVPDSLMGISKDPAKQKGFDEHNYKHVQSVRVTYPGLKGEPPNIWVDQVKGLNKPHALERAYRNWDGAEIEAISDEEYQKGVAAGQYSVKVPEFKGTGDARRFGHQASPGELQGLKDKHAELKKEFDDLGKRVFAEKDEKKYSELSQQWSNMAGQLQFINDAIMQAEDRHPAGDISTDSTWRAMQAAAAEQGIELKDPDKAKEARPSKPMSAKDTELADNPKYSVKFKKPKANPILASIKKGPRIRMRTSGNVSFDGNVVRFIEDAVSLVAHIRKGAQEEAYFVTTDKNGVVLEIHKYSKGLKDRSQMSPIESAGHILNIKGARNAYFIHNHPSGAIVPSAEDIGMTALAGEILKLKGISVEGAVIGGTKYSAWRPTNTNVEMFPDLTIRPALRKVKIPIKERYIARRQDQTAPKLISPSVVRDYMAENALGTGFVLLDTQLRPVDFVPVNSKNAGKTITKNLIQAAEKSNSVGSVFFSETDNINQEFGDYLKSLQSAIGQGGDHVIHDVITPTKSYYEAGSPLKGDQHPGTAWVKARTAAKVADFSVKYSLRRPMVQGAINRGHLDEKHLDVALNIDRLTEIDRQLELGGGGRPPANWQQVNKALDGRPDLVKDVREIEENFGVRILDDDGHLATHPIEREMKIAEEDAVGHKKGDVIPAHTMFTRYLTQEYMDNMDPAEREGFRQAISKSLEEAYEEGKAANIALQNIGSGAFKINPALRKAHKTGGALNFNTKCPMLNIGAHGCYWKSCYMVGQAKGGRMTPFYRSAAYFADILQLKQESIDALNAVGGLRINGQGDTDWQDRYQWRDAIRHAQMRGLDLKVISKQDDTLKILDWISKGDKKEGLDPVDISGIVVQPTVDPFWIPITLDEIPGSAASELGLVKAEERNLGNKAVQDAIIKAYESMGREAKVIDGRVHRKYGYSWEQIKDRAKKYPNIQILPRLVLATNKEIAESALHVPEALQTWMHAKGRDGMYSDIEGRPITEKDTKNFGRRIAVFKDDAGEWRIEGQVPGGGNETRPGGPYLDLENYIKDTYNKTNQEKIFSTLATQLETDPSSLCCPVGANPDACMDCSSSCAQGVYYKGQELEVVAENGANALAGATRAQYMVKAYHGSPYAFDRFDATKIGSGEGHQAFGYGLYFTTKKGIARHYARALGSKKYHTNIDGKLIMDATDLMINFPEIARHVGWSEVVLSAEAYEEDPLAALDPVEDMVGALTDPAAKKAWKEFLDLLTAGKIKRMSARNLYEVAIHKGKKPSDYRYIDWYEPVEKDILRRVLNGLDTDELINDNRINREELFITIGELKDQLRPEQERTEAWRSRAIEMLTEDISAGGDAAEYNIYAAAGLEKGTPFTEFTDAQIEKALISENLDDYIPAKPNATAKSLYNALQMVFRSGPRASRFLLEHGIDGIRYPAESLSGKTPAPQRVAKKFGNKLWEIFREDFPEGLDIDFAGVDEISRILISNAAPALSGDKSAIAAIERIGDLHEGVKEYFESDAGLKAHTKMFEAASEKQDLNYVVFDDSQVTIEKRQSFSVKSPEFKRWFGDSQVTDDFYEPMVMYHGTRHVFDSFLPGDFGSHFGTAAQANQVAYVGTGKNKMVYPVFLKVENPVRLIDYGHFMTPNVSDQLLDQGVLTKGEHAEVNSIYEKESFFGGYKVQLMQPDNSYAVVDQAGVIIADNFETEEDALEYVNVNPGDFNSYLRDLLIEKGYDGAVYLNRRELGNPLAGVFDEMSEDEVDEMTDEEFLEEFPGAEDSWMVFEPNQIKSAIGNRGTYDPADPRIQYSVKSPEFQRWFKDSQVVDEDGDPLEVYHGTSHSFEAFDKNRANLENHFGKGFYFSNERYDSDYNYSGIGPDLTNRIEREQEKLLSYIEEDPEEFGLDEDADFETEARRLATERLYGGNDQVIPAYLSFQNPAIIGGEGQTMLEAEAEVDEETGEWIVEPTGTLIDFMGALRHEASLYDDVEVEEAIGELIDWSGMDSIPLDKAINILRESEGLAYAVDYDNNAALASSEILRAALERTGFDGIIDRTVDEKFGSQAKFGKPMDGMHPGVVHYIAFEPNQIKASTGNNTYDPHDNRFMYSVKRAEGLRTIMPDVLNKKLPGKGSAKQMKQMVQAFVKKGEFKQEELEWSGLEDWLDDQDGKVTKQQIIDYLTANEIRVEEVTKEGQRVLDPYHQFDLDTDLDDEWLEIRWQYNTNAPRWTEYVDHDADALQADYPEKNFTDAEIALIKNYQEENDAYHEYQTQGEYTGGFIKDARLPEKEMWSADTPLGRFLIYTDESGTVTTQIDGQPFGAEYEDVEEARLALEEHLNENYDSSPHGTMFEQYTLPGGENYRELLLTLPARSDALREVLAHRYNTLLEEVDAAGDRTNVLMLKEIAEEGDNVLTPLERRLIKAWDAQNALVNEQRAYGNSLFTDSHWQEPNVLAHIRFNERTGLNGEQILFIEEIQSDWHQKGRRRGYRGSGPKVRVKKVGTVVEYAQSEFIKKNPDWPMDHIRSVEEISMGEISDLPKADQDRIIAATKKGTFGNDSPVWVVEDENGKIVSATMWGKRTAERRANRWVVIDPDTNMLLFPNSRFYTKGEAQLAADGVQRDREESMVPNAPFKRTWPMLAFKRAARWAAENGFDQIAWAPGEVQADRYDLSKHLSGVAYVPRSDGQFHVHLYDTNNVHLDQYSGKKTEAEVEELLGKEILQKMQNGEGEKRGSQQLVLRDKNLKVGGEGMKGFYDKMLPSEVNKFFNKKAWGKAKVETTKIETLEAPGHIFENVEIEPNPDPDGANFLVWARRQATNARVIVGSAETIEGATSIAEKTKELGQKEVWVLPVTEQMKDKVTKHGLPLFSIKRMSPAGRAYLEALQAAAPDSFEGGADYDGDPFEGLSDETRERILAAKGIPVPGFMKVAGKYIKERWNDMRRHRPYLDPKEYADLANVLRIHQETPENSKRRALQAMIDILSGMKKKQYEIFSLKLIMDDMMADIENGLLSDKEELPFGFTQDEAAKFHRTITRRVKSDPIIASAIERRNAFQDRLKAALVEADLLPESVLEEPRYFHHQVLEFRALEELGEAYQGVGVGGRDVRLKKKGWQRGRVGSIKDYNSDYAQAEFEVLAQAIAQLETKDTMDRVKGLTDATEGFKLQAKAANNALIIEEFLAEMNAKDPQSRTWTTETLKKSFRSRTKDDWLKRMLQVLRERKAHMREHLGDKFVNYKDLAAADGFIGWKPKPGQTWYKAFGISDRLVAAMQEGEVVLGPDNMEQIRQIMARGKDVEWLVKPEIAKTLDGYDVVLEDHPLSRASRTLMTMWKQWILINPFRVAKYNINNMSGDMDISIAYDPRIVYKYLPKVLKDLTAEAYGGKIDKVRGLVGMKPTSLSKELQAELDEAYTLGVLGSGWSIQEVVGVNSQLGFQKQLEALMGERPGLHKKAWRALANFTSYRENLLRLAAFRYFKDQVAAGKAVYGASNKFEVDGVSDPTERSAKLARELIGDYGNLTHAGQWLRRHMIPFYAWMEVNAPRYVRMIANLKHEGRSSTSGGVKGGLILGKNIAWKGTKLAVKASALYSLVMLWNQTFFPDEEEELGESQRRQLHLILGRRDDGTIISLRVQGALSDALAWFGGEDLHHDIKDVVEGKVPISEKAREAALAVPTKFVHGLRPDAKVLGELVGGKSWYPDPWNPRPIRDKWEHLARLFSLDTVVRYIEGRPKRGGKVGTQLVHDLMKLGLYSSDPGESAYYDTIRQAIDWAEENGKSRTGGTPTSKSNALYYYKQALKYGDLKAAERYLTKYFELGGKPRSLIQSVKRAHPLGTLAMRDRNAFLDTLGPQEKQTYEIALKWYNNTYKSTESRDMPLDVWDKFLDNSQGQSPEKKTMTIRDAKQLFPQ